MSISASQKNNLKQAFQNGLMVFARPVPQTVSEWADENFYLSAESTYIESRWETLPFKRPF